MQDLLQNPPKLPAWLTTGRTVLMQKDPQKGSQPSNYRPITCLPTMWKIFPGILADTISNHLQQNGLLAHEQKGARPGCRGTKDQLLIDKILFEDSRQRRTNLPEPGLITGKPLNPLSYILRNSRQGYKLKSEQKINHLLYMDDLKLYGKNEKEIEALITDVSMEFGLDKCTRQITHRGKVKLTEGLQMSIGKINDVQLGEGYKYLGILQNMENMQKEAKTNATITYKKRLRQVIQSKLNGQFKMQAINSYALPVITYTAGITDWNKNELEELDHKTRKIVTMHGALHPRADIHRMYLPRNCGGRDLQEVRPTVDLECAGITKYIHTKKGEDLLINAVWQHQTQGRECEPSTRKALKKKWIEEVEEITKREHAYRWTASAGLKVETEALTTAAQDQALNTKYHQTKTLRVSNDPKCKMCKLADETISHITSACQNLAGPLYLTRHNDLASAIHRIVCQNYIHIEPVPWQHKPN
ncbi:hypothetical protein HOLleu_34958 [Holothuria leucospilota]|uniref:Reverse transcriptase domain-containing protein n=1 Tax=Holothuria leucospilota TaxID=206669 RepID=A0A9Q1BFR0_HOLLE|nr:hypothetical protein HOLleu_34958 [Holothuria leucospilota]